MIKQVIVVRKDLNMRKGKMCAQVAHASLMCFLDASWSHDERGKYNYSISKESDWADWLREGQTKVVVGCETKEEFMELYEKAIKANLPCVMVTDAGKTEFHGKPTQTTMAIGPADSGKVDTITGHLKLL